MKPWRAKNEIATTPLAALKRGLEKSDTSSIGWDVRRSTNTKITSSDTPSTRLEIVRTEPQPHPGASITPKTTIATPTLDSRRPATSSGGVSGSREVGTTQ